MTISLRKGEDLPLAGGLQQVSVGLGWDVRQGAGADFDLDAACFLLADTGQVRSDADFIFYNQRTSACGAVEHAGDNRTGAGEGDDEVIHVDLARVPDDVVCIVFAVTIYQAQQRRQSFWMVNSAFIRLISRMDGHEVARFDLTNEGRDNSALIFANLCRSATGWRFQAVGETLRAELGELAVRYGVAI